MSKDNPAAPYVCLVIAMVLWASTFVALGKIQLRPVRLNDEPLFRQTIQAALVSKDVKEPIFPAGCTVYRWKGLLKFLRKTEVR